MPSPSMKAPFGCGQLLRAWPVAVGVAAFLMHLVYLYPGGPWLPSPGLVLFHDEGTVLGDSLRIARGQVMFRDFFEFQGPVFYYLNAAVFAITEPSVTAARVLIVLVSATASALVAWIVAPAVGRVAGVACGVIHACITLPMWPCAYPHWLAESLILIGLALLVYGERDFWAGVCFGLSAATIQSFGLPVLAAAAGVRLLAGPRKGLSVAAGGAAALAVVLLYFAVCGALPSLVYDTVVWPAQQYANGQRDATTYAHYVDEFVAQHARFGQPWRFLGVATLRLIEVLPIGAVVAFIVALALALRSRGDRKAAARLTLAAVGAAAAAPLLLGVTRRDLTHVAFVGGVALVGTVMLLGPLAARRWGGRAAAGALVVLLAAVTAASYAHKVLLTRPAAHELPGWRELVLRDPNAAWLDETLAPGEPTVYTAHSGYFYLYVRPPAVGYTYLPTESSDYLTDEQWGQVADDITRARPRAMYVGAAQWTRMTRLRPDLRRLYQGGRGRLVLAGPQNE